MEDNKYNGWTNYATWRIALELIDTDYWLEQYEGNDPLELEDMLEGFVQEILDREIGNEGAGTN